MPTRKRNSDNRQTGSTELPSDEWDFFSDEKKLPDERERNAWLNYEYARSCRPIVEAVRQIRSSEPPARPSHRFAVFLAKQFPEFPSKAWLNISPARRGQLREQGVIPESDPFEERVSIRVHDVNDFVRDVTEGNLRLTNSIYDERFSVLEINFESDNAEITRVFANWLDARREFLLKQYDEQTETRSGVTFNPNVAFKTRPFKLPPGQGKNKRQYENYLKRLAALRLMVFYGDWSEAERHADLGGGRSLYQDQKSWQRAADVAAELMIRLFAVWKYTYGFPFILDPKRNIHAFLPSVCRSPLPPNDTQMTSARRGIREFIKRHVMNLGEISEAELRKGS